MKATVELKKITPEIATEWLADKWGEQRTVRANHVARLASDMTAGRFLLSPDAILRVKGKLANGQHRLAAVAESGKPQTFIVMESNDDDLYKVIDAGLRRTVSDGLMGMDHARDLPSIARWMQAYEGKTVRRAARGGGEAGADLAPTQTEVIDYCLSNKDLLCEAASFVGALYHQTKLLHRSVGAAIYCLASKAEKLERAKDFLQKVYLDGGNNAAGDLRNRLIANKGSKAKLPSGYMFGITLKAFRSFTNGSRPGVLKWAKDEGLPEI